MLLLPDFIKDQPLMSRMLIDQKKVVLFLGYQKQVECLTQIHKLLLVFLLRPDIIGLGAS